MKEKEKIGYISTTRLIDFANHPFKVEENSAFYELMDSIQRDGVLVPLIVRESKASAGNYEIISGHRRKTACVVLGINEVPAIIRELDDDQAVLEMVDSNLQREHIKPSEKAFAYKMKLEALQNQGRSFGQLDQKSGGYDARKELSKQIGESERQIQRYIRLTNLIPKILQMVDDGVIAFTVAVELSYLTEDEQYELHAVMDIEQCTPSLSQANRMKRMSQGEVLDMDMIYQVLEEIKPNQREVIKLDLSKVAKYMPRNYTPKQIEDLIEKLLMDWSVSNRTYS
ncbi:MAG: ParB/RepB/Spo0J family partition protein [Eubacteriales bacterium]|nr:ParB/RepB/Spo0J family partition protein [Eubacteriales bacterium]